MGPPSVLAVLITGTVGSGKTAVAADIGDILAQREVPTAVIDLDWLGWAAPLPAGGELTPHELILRNLGAIWPNYRSAGIQRFVLVRAIQSPQEVEALRGALLDAQIHVVRLTASAATIAERLRRRDSGAVLEEHLIEAGQFTTVLDEIQVEDLIVVNEGRSIRDVALELLGRLGWT